MIREPKFIEPPRPAYPVYQRHLVRCLFNGDYDIAHIVNDAARLSRCQSVATAALQLQRNVAELLTIVAFDKLRDALDEYRDAATIDVLRTAMELVGDIRCLLARARQ